MALTYPPQLKADRMTATRDYAAGGTLEILDGATVLVAFPLSMTGGSVSGDVWAIQFGTGAGSKAVADADGNANTARIRPRNGAPITGLTVGTLNSSVNLNNTSINRGQSVELKSATIRHAE